MDNIAAALPTRNRGVLEFRIMKDFLFVFLGWLFTLPVLIGAIGFAVYNGEQVAVTYSPFSLPDVMPLYVPVLFAVAFGFLFGALMTWAAMGRLRAERRALKKEVKLLEKKIRDHEDAAAPVIPAGAYHSPIVPAAFLTKG